MSLARVEAIVNAVLYEGYVLYPYRPSSVKNRQRWTFGGVYPRAYAAEDESSPSAMQTECLVRGGAQTEIDVHVRFLQLLRREVGELAAPVAELPVGREPSFATVPSLTVGEKTFHAWEEAVERDVSAPALTLSQLRERGMRVPFSFAGSRTWEQLNDPDGLVVGVLVRTCESLDGELAIAGEEVAPDIFRLSVRIDNLTGFEAVGSDRRAEAQRRAFASTHTILTARHGAFISLLDPPEELKDAAASCDNSGTWPVLAGEKGETDIVLSSPIILYDHPQVAAESPGDLFDSTEIDEILTLRILAMTDEEKREMAANDERSRALLERTEALTAEDMARLHGTLRNPRFGVEQGGQAFEPRRPSYAKPELAFLSVHGMDFKVGDRVRLRPKEGGDIMDLVLKDEVALIEAIERDFEDRVHVAVVLEADPGREFGMERMPGHRFFFSPEEIEPLSTEGEA